MFPMLDLDWYDLSGLTKLMSCGQDGGYWPQLSVYLYGRNEAPGRTYGPQRDVIAIVIIQTSIIHQMNHFWWISPALVTLGS